MQLGLIERRDGEMRTMSIERSWRDTFSEVSSLDVWIKAGSHKQTGAQHPERDGSIYNGNCAIRGTGRGLETRGKGGISQGKGAIVFIMYFMNEHLATNFPSGKLPSFDMRL